MLRAASLVIALMKTGWTFLLLSLLLVFEPIFATSELESQAYSICNGDQFCLFDIAATGRIDVGMSTQIGGQALEEIIEISAPSKCTIFTHYNTVAVADSGGVRGVQMHPPLAASMYFCLNNCTSPSIKRLYSSGLQ